jgi:sugar phosphate isomerase/epimerase
MLGIIQGRLTYSGKKLQAFPKNPFDEFKIASNIKYDFIEFFAERNINKNNPIWSNEGIKSYIKFARLNNIKIYSFCDDYYIKNSLAEEKNLTYALRVLKRVNLLKIKKYIIPLYGRSFINSKNEKKIIKNLSLVSKVCSHYKIELLLESNMTPKKFEEIKKNIKSNNCFFLFDTGNRVILKRDFFSDLQSFGINIGHIHLKDKNNFKKNVIIGKGLVNFELLFFYLKKIKYKSSFSIESQRGTNIFEQAKKNYNFFQRLIQKHKIYDLK